MDGIDQGQTQQQLLRPITSGRRQLEDQQGVGRSQSLNVKGGVGSNETLNVEVRVGR
jgi:hypothetical protein